MGDPTLQVLEDTSVLEVFTTKPVLQESSNEISLIEVDSDNILIESVPIIELLQVETIDNILVESTEIQILETAEQGPRGPLGPVGIDLTFTFVQNSPSSVWNINHNMGKHPSVTIVDSGGSQVIGDLVYVDSNNLTLSFSAAFSGKAYLN